MTNPNKPAFPVHPVAHERGDAEYAMLSGMTLREYYAGQALAGILASPEGTGYDSCNVAKAAILAADALIAALQES